VASTARCAADAVNFNFKNQEPMTSLRLMTSIPMAA